MAAGIPGSCVATRGCSRAVQGIISCSSQRLELSSQSSWLQPEARSRLASPAQQEDPLAPQQPGHPSW